jgi:PLP dependent protein
MIAENFKNLQKHVELACQKCGRTKDDIQIIAVSKTFSIEKIRDAVAAGQIDFGENYVQELREKQQVFVGQQIRWHFIGHLQSNKAKYIAEFVYLIHSVDDLNLGNEIDKRARQCNRVQDVLVEVHTTDEASKFGVRPEKTIELVKELSRLQNLKICGLMTMGPFADDPNLSRLSFRQLTELKRQIETEGIEHVDMKHLSMGMTHDFEVAIEEGATILRVGTAIFGERIRN